MYDVKACESWVFCLHSVKIMFVDKSLALTNRPPPCPRHSSFTFYPQLEEINCGNFWRWCFSWTWKQNCIWRLINTIRVVVTSTLVLDGPHFHCHLFNRVGCELGKNQFAGVILRLWEDEIWWWWRFYNVSVELYSWENMKCLQSVTYTYQSIIVTNSYL